MGLWESSNGLVHDVQPLPRCKTDVSSIILWGSEETVCSQCLWSCRGWLLVKEPGEAGSSAVPGRIPVAAVSLGRQSLSVLEVPASGSLSELKQSPALVRKIVLGFHVSRRISSASTSPSFQLILETTKTACNKLVTLQSHWIAAEEKQQQ